MEIVHTPVLLNECLEYLSPVGEPFENHALMIDSTLGEGGHTFNFLSKFPNLSVYLSVTFDFTLENSVKPELF